MKQEGREVVKKKAFVPPPRFMNIDEARYHFYQICFDVVSR